MLRRRKALNRSIILTVIKDVSQLHIALQDTFIKAPVLC
jgi:hypothetical protein